MDDQIEVLSLFMSYSLKFIFVAEIKLLIDGVAVLWYGKRNDYIIAYEL